MIFMENGLAFDTNKSELIYSKDNSDWYEDSCTKYYITPNDIFFTVKFSQKRIGFRRKKLGDIEYTFYKRSLSDMCCYLEEAPICIREKFIERFLKKTWKDEKEKTMDTNYEKAMSLKNEYENLKKELEAIKAKMLSVKQKAKDELNWIMSEKIEDK